jgi:mono/diheme cytochrome c family protein
MENTFAAAPKFLTGEGLDQQQGAEIAVNHLEGEDREQYVRGWKLYHEDGSCGTCHQNTGKGLVASGFPPLAGSRWVKEQPEVLARILLKGLIGPIQVNGRNYPGQVPMTPYEDLLSDAELADVMTYVRNAFGNRASVISEAFVARVRAEIEAAGQQGYYRAEDLEPLLQEASKK